MMLEVSKDLCKKIEQYLESGLSKGWDLYSDLVKSRPDLNFHRISINQSVPEGFSGLLVISDSKSVAVRRVNLVPTIKIITGDLIFDRGESFL